jgi:hypothetical protein
VFRFFSGLAPVGAGLVCIGRSHFLRLFAPHKVSSSGVQRPGSEVFSVAWRVTIYEKNTDFAGAFFIFHPSSSTPPKTSSHTPGYGIKLLLTPLLSYASVPMTVQICSYNLLAISSLSVVSTFFIHLQRRNRLYSSTLPRAPGSVSRNV